MKFHSFADLFPLIEGKDFAELKADIAANGVREPIWVYDGQILDGRNRWLACSELGVEPPTRTYDGDEPLAFVISLNLHRRHLDESQRAMVAARIANLDEGRPKETAQVCAVSQERAAEMLNVSRRSVQTARKVVDEGTPELAAAVSRGKVSVSAAADVAELPKEQQRQIVAKGEKEILEAAKQIRAGRSEKRREERVEAVRVMANPTPELPAQRYPVVYADPPWRYEFAESESRAIENQYPTMTLEDIRALKVSELVTDDAILFMWATSPKLAEAMSVIEAWGFTYRSSAVWVKPQLGMGYYFRQQHELLLVATKGGIPAPAPGDRPRSVVTADRLEHSQKPSEFAEAIEAMYPTLPKIELFCRSPRAGWAVWGNQAAA